MQEKEIITGIFRIPKKLGKSLFYLGFALMMFGLFKPFWNYTWGSRSNFSVMNQFCIYFLPCLTLGFPLCYHGGSMSLEQSITVTNLRVYGTSGGKKIDIPKEQITSVESYNNVITIRTASGKINFSYLVNCADVYKAILNLTYRTQESAPNNTISQAEELKKYKDLLDSGVISQEEFNAKKKQLLGL